MIGVGIGLLHLSPDDFWSMTPREITAAMNLLFGDEQKHKAPGRDCLERLMQKFPD